MVFKIKSIGLPTWSSGQRLSLMLGAATAAWAAPAWSETLMDAVSAAYATNPTLSRERFNQQSTNENYVQARALYGPTLSLSAVGDYDYVRTPLLGSFRDTNTRTGQAELTLRQTVYSGGRLRGQLAEQRANVRSSEEQLRRVEGQTVRNVIAVYAALLRDQQRLEVARQNVAVLQAQVDERLAKRRVRDVTITDVAQSDARLSAGQVQLATAEAQLAISAGTYLQIVGHEAGDLQPLPELPGLPESIGDAFKIADLENAEVAAARYAEEASRANIATQRGGQRPTAAVVVQGTKTGSLEPFDRHKLRTEVTAQLTVTQQLLAGGAIRSRIRQAQAQNGADQAIVDGQRRQALQDVLNAWSTLSSTRVGVVEGTHQVEAAQIAFAGMRSEERYGLRSTIEVLNAEQELASAQLTLLGSRYSEYVARADLLLAMGRLDVRTINSALPAKDPEAEFKKVRFRGMLPTDPAAMLIDHIGSASPYSKRKPDLRGAKQPAPTKATIMPPTPGKEYTEKRMTPMEDSPLVPADQLRDVKGYETAPADPASPR